MNRASRRKAPHALRAAEAYDLSPANRAYAAAASAMLAGDIGRAKILYTRCLADDPFHIQSLHDLGVVDGARRSARLRGCTLRTRDRPQVRPCRRLAQQGLIAGRKRASFGRRSGRKARRSAEAFLCQQLGGACSCAELYVRPRSCKRGLRPGPGDQPGLGTSPPSPSHHPPSHGGREGQSRKLRLSDRPPAPIGDRLPRTWHHTDRGWTAERSRGCVPIGVGARPGEQRCADGAEPLPHRNRRPRACARRTRPRHRSDHRTAPVSTCCAASCIRSEAASRTRSRG